MEKVLGIYYMLMEDIFVLMLTLLPLSKSMHLSIVSERMMILIMRRVLLGFKKKLL